MKRLVTYKFVDERYEIDIESIKNALFDNFGFSFNKNRGVSVDYGLDKKAEIRLVFQSKYIDLDEFIKIKKYCLDNMPLLKNIKIEKNELKLYFKFYGVFLVT